MCLVDMHALVVLIDQLRGNKLGLLVTKASLQITILRNGRLKVILNIRHKWMKRQ